MTPEQIDLWLQIQHRQMLALERIADLLDKATTSTKAPNYQRKIEEFKHFDWSTIDATVERADQYGAAIVTWKGYQFVRRSPSNKFGAAVWFSRCTGKDETTGENVYERLITFKPLADKEVDPLPEKVSRYL
ncbi:single-stranded DNA-binding protein [Anabaena sp. 4-3]|uniref:single-stranded DNA-binding protein n=1 Tax=Anabaena sp. 4-3 TaxID=1811979 RepID=UPI000831B702|nr:single-stranded DNA-binding protein [Anabaena sp. 4-3]